MSREPISVVSFCAVHQDRVRELLEGLPTLEVEHQSTEWRDEIDLFTADVVIAEHPFGPERDDAALSQIVQSVRDTPVLAWLPSSSREIVESALRAGARDWLVESEMDVWLLEQALCQASRRPFSTEVLASSERRMRAMFESGLDAQLILDERGVCTDANSTACGLFGLTPDKLIGQSLTGLLSDKAATLEWSKFDAPNSTAVLTLALASGPTKLELRLRRVKPEVRHLVLRATSPSQHPSLVDSRIATMNTLSAAIGHEINNPLTYVIANLDYALGELSQVDADEETLESLREALEGARRITRIVGDLRPLGRGTEDELVDVVTTLETAIRQSWNQIRHTAQFSRDLHEVPPVRGDRGRLCQVFVNLLVNASQAFPEGDARQHEISVSTRMDGENVVIAIRDTGQGIRPGELTKIFQPFFSTKPVGTGSGLGLFVCRDIVEAMGGQIDVTSTFGVGSCFQITLPAVQSADERASEYPVAKPLPERRRVLVIDDEPAVARAIARVLASVHEVNTAADAREALLSINAGARYDVILCDVMMPIMTGMAFHAAMLEHAPELAQRIVFVTGGIFTPEAEEFLARIPNFRLAKPLDREMLMQTISKVEQSALEPARTTLRSRGEGSIPWELSLRFPKSWDRLDAVRESAGYFTRATYADLVAAERVGLVVHELVENAIKYSLPGDAQLSVDLHAIPGAFRINVRNRSSAELFGALKDALSAVLADEPEQAYLRALARCRTRPANQSGLGLPRLAYEAQVELSAKLERDEAVVVAMGRV
jgi:signal transduction histidine kinase/CheY-like chemotaxis protein